MAQTRRKRQTKHRGNAAGVVESRGRTGRKPTAAEKSGTATSSVAARKKEIDRRDKPPTWKAAFYKAMVATVLLLFVILVFMKGSSGAIALFPAVLIAYTVVSYYTDKWVYERRQRKKAGAGKAQTP
jgi:glycerol uptake facilitator-like aquaporin